MVAAVSEETGAFSDSYDCSDVDGADDSVNDAKDNLIRKLLIENKILKKEVKSLRASHDATGNQRSFSSTQGDVPGRNSGWTVKKSRIRKNSHAANGGSAELRRYSSDVCTKVFAKKSNECSKDEFGNPGFGNGRSFKEKPKVCRYYLNDKCHFGERCRNLHIRYNCKYFQENRCWFGNQCWNRHRKVEALSDKNAAASEDVDEEMNRGAISKADEITDEEESDVKDQSILEDEKVTEMNAQAEESYKEITDEAKCEVVKRNNSSRSETSTDDVKGKMEKQVEAAKLLLRSKKKKKKNRKENQTIKKDAENVEVINDENDTKWKVGDQELSSKEWVDMIGQMTEPVMYKGSWYDYMKMNQVQKDLYHKEEEECRLEGLKIIEGFQGKENERGSV